MSIRFATLGLLAEQPLHGYAIQSALAEQFGDLCDPSFGEVYRVLTAHAREGLVAIACVRVGKRPRRKVHTLTPEGRRVLSAWLLVTTPATGRARDELALRLLVAQRCAPELVPRIVDLQAQRCRSDLADLEAQQRAARPPASFAALVLALRLETDVRQARARADSVVVCGELLARHRAGVPVAVLAREIAARATGRRPACAD